MNNSNLLERLKVGVSDPALWSDEDTVLHLDRVNERLHEAAAHIEVLTGEARQALQFIPADATGWAAEVRSFLRSIAASGLDQHASDCAVHNAPALPPGLCDCGGPA